MTLVATNTVTMEEQIDQMIDRAIDLNSGYIALLIPKTPPKVVPQEPVPTPNYWDEGTTTYITTPIQSRTLSVPGEPPF